MILGPDLSNSEASYTLNNENACIFWGLCYDSDLRHILLLTGI